MFIVEILKLGVKKSGWSNGWFACGGVDRGTSLMRNRTDIGPYSVAMPPIEDPTVWLGPMVVLGRWAVSHERVTQVGVRACVLRSRVWGVVGFMGWV